VANEISVGRQTAFLTPEDVAIAKQLSGIYGSDIPAALASSEAAQLRFNNQLRAMGDLGQEINRGMFVEFSQNIRAGASAWDAFKNAGVNALGKIADKLASMAADNLWKSAFGGGSSGFNLGSLFGLGGGGSASAGPITLGGANGPVPFYADGTDFAPGGMAVVGERGPELVNLPRGSQVIPNDKLGGGGMVVQGGDTHITVQGNADEKTLALMRQELAARDRAFADNVVKTVRRAKQGRQLP
jgi:hypothetical protein